MINRCNRLNKKVTDAVSLGRIFFCPFETNSDNSGGKRANKMAREQTARASAIYASVDSRQESEGLPC